MEKLKKNNIMNKFKTGHWYCKYCQKVIEPKSVTYDEKCEICNTPVDFIDVTASFLFNQTEKEFYELTGLYPLLYAKDINSDYSKIVGCKEYIDFLVNKIKKLEKGNIKTNR